MTQKSVYICDSCGRTVDSPDKELEWINIHAGGGMATFITYSSDTSVSPSVRSFLRGADFCSPECLCSFLSKVRAEDRTLVNEEDTRDAVWGECE